MNFRTSTLLSSFVFAWMLVTCESAWPQTRLSAAVDWPQVLAACDLQWTALPKAWDEGPFTGNGRYGAMMHTSTDGKSFIIKINRGDVQDHRRELGTHNGLCRLPIGYFAIRPVGQLSGCQMRLDLWNAEVRGELITDRGRIELHQYTHAELPLIVVEIVRHGGETDARLEWESYPAISPRQVFARSDPRNRSKFSPNYVENGPPRVELTKLGGRSIQDLAHGWQTCAAWRRQDEGTTTRIVATIAHEKHPQSAVEAAEEIASELAKRKPDELLASHRRWRNRFYPRSFVSIPDGYWQTFYWIQLYKLASTTRSDGMIVDTCGVWLEPDTLWPLIWWNLNVQLTYSPAVASNHADLARSLTDALDRYETTLQANASRQKKPGRAAIGRVSDQHCDSIGSGPELSNLTWALHNYWLVYRHTMDETMLRERLYPLLKQNLRHSLDSVTLGDDGRLHTPQRVSPEYLSSPDTAYDLALIRWGLLTLIETSKRLEIDADEREQWRDALLKLRDFPIDESGFQVAPDRPLAEGHRHYSHLLMIYPLYLVNRDRDDEVPLIRRSLEHWQSFKNGKEGYSMTGAASMAAALGDGDEALKYLDGLKPYLRPNTMYRETGPVIETPLAGAQSILDMLLQSWGGTIRVLPAVPSKWKNAAFHDLSAEGGFLVSAVRIDGRTRTVRVVSRAGQPCRIETDLERPFRVIGNKSVRDNGRVIEADLAIGEELILYTGKEPQVPKPVKNTTPFHTFGLASE